LNALGVHVLLELKECNPALLDDLDYVKKVMVDAAREVGATIVGESFHRFSPQGVTGVLAIAESHISIHTWPEYRYAAADIFTCGTAIKPKIAAQYLIDKLECKRPGISEIYRGTEVLEPVGPR
jgi:S-adenosylmethionine decarboxylase